MTTRDPTLAARWPDQLIRQICSGNFMLVVGAGISRGCVNEDGKSPPSWKELIDELASKFTSGTSRADVRELASQGRYLEAAEFIRARARSQSKEDDFLQRIAEVTDGGSKAEKQYQPGKLHETLLGLEPAILVTTNYDRILERATRNGYNVHSYDSTTLGRDVRLGATVLVKVHGSVDSTSEIVLTRSDYTRLRRDGARALEVLQALFLTKTALFVGYSFSDPDIQLLLENVLGARGNIAAHYLLTSKAIAAYQQDIFEYCYGTTVIAYKDGDYAEMRRMLELLLAQVEVTKVS